MNTDRSEETIDDFKKGKFNWNSSFNRSKISLKTLNDMVSEKRPPWKGNSFNPDQLYRFNYLEQNKDDALEKRYKNRVFKYTYFIIKVDFIFILKTKSFNQNTIIRQVILIIGSIDTDSNHFS